MVWHIFTGVVGWSLNSVPLLVEQGCGRDSEDWSRGKEYCRNEISICPPAVLPFEEIVLWESFMRIIMDNFKLYDN